MRHSPALRPWPLGLPLLRAIKRDPLGVPRRLQKEYGDVVLMNILSTRVYYLFHPEAARKVLVDHYREFPKEERVLRIFRSVEGENVITTEGRLWERHRKLIAPTFAPKQVPAYIALMVASADDGIRADLPVRVGESAVVQVDRWTSRLTMDVILRTLFSYQGSREEADAVSEASSALTRQMMRQTFWPFVPPEWLPYPGRAAKRKGLAVIRNLIVRQIEERRHRATAGQQIGSDILDLLLAAHDDGARAHGVGLSDEEIVDNCVGLFGAGRITSATALTWWIGLMAIHREIAQRVREEVRSAQTACKSASEVASLPFLNATLKEALRLYPPSTATFTRKALQDIELDGEIIKKDSVVAIPIWAFHHDERWYPDPEEYRPARFMPEAPALPRGAFMPFGAGPHFCLGQHFAMMEMALISARLISNFEFSLDARTTWPAPIIDLVFRPQGGLRVRFTRCH
jgi:cytochrome P450